MPSTKPSVLRAWQERPETDRPPTIYDQRNPAMPWLALDQDSEEALDDQHDARAWASSRCSGTLASMSEPKSGNELKERKHRAERSAALEPLTFTPTGNYSFRVYVDGQLAACKRPADETRPGRKGWYGCDQ